MQHTVLYNIDWREGSSYSSGCNVDYIVVIKVLFIELTVIVLLQLQATKRYNLTGFKQPSTDQA